MRQWGWIYTQVQGEYDRSSREESDVPCDMTTSNYIDINGAVSSDDPLEKYIDIL